ncbi:GL25936 [Drosophila persimilis]|uniref:small monomeric GTPase n=2 Tax=pseudoobscura subgroup TaxID=32358 RepID=Q29NY6_DROPS|nr:ras-related and estrogen-regulated growth inhibitor [Drosophila pseudoobscura]XP_002018696.1 ras-related and estrogen-regulated growth inhibitor [Drosophila persimilis]XP_015035522.1 ras-related and estrogen-regulated growth inhibitor [Drosophila pseudoobscura]XP_026843453.1 ras-related and estrogen-regulated growth inhibitor [Drosophila persimilis]EDW36892.1 GL25936 [Drosophila persimilis]
MNATSPKSSLVKLGLHTNKQKTLKVMVLGQSGVGKTAMVVRFITRRFIGEYDPNLEKIYTCQTTLDKEQVQFDILDATGQLQELDGVTLESNIRWADAFILMYSITDKCSFDECSRLKFLINYNKRRRKLGSASKEYTLDIPVILVGNKTDQPGDRMVSLEEGQRRFRELSCACFHEISVRESVDQVLNVFRDVFRFWRVFTKFPKLKRSTSDVANAADGILTPDSGSCSFYDASSLGAGRRSFLVIGSACLEESSGGDHTESTDEIASSSLSSSRSDIDAPFRSRASTDGTLLSRPRRWRYPPPGCLLPHTNRVERRMSISTRGSNASY